MPVGVRGEAMLIASASGALKEFEHWTGTHDQAQYPGTDAHKKIVLVL